MERIKQHLKIMSGFTSTPNEGMTRFSYSPEDVKTRKYIKEMMKEYGLTVREDGLGNIFGRLEGTLPDAPSVLVGSHFDSVPHGGNFDGIAGVIAGLEVAALFHDHQLKPAHPLEVVAMIEEEGARFAGGLMGSRGINGLIDKPDFHRIRDKDGISVIEAMQKAGLDPTLPIHRDPKTMKAFIELHIEQGPVLEEKNIPIGIVEKIVGMTQLEVTVEGRAGHAGTTPMDYRQDALLTAAKIVSGLPELAEKEGKGTVITTGQFNVYPNGANIIPERVVFTIDLRSGEETAIRRVLEKGEALILSEQKDGIKISIKQQLYIQPKELSREIQALFKQSSEKLGLSCLSMQSGAGHDAMIFSDFTEAGLLFIPSKDGISHSPKEWSELEHLAQGIDVLFETVKELSK